MTRLERIIKAFNDYDEMVDRLSDGRIDCLLYISLKKLRSEVSVLIEELEKHGCRRKY